MKWQWNVVRKAARADRGRGLVTTTTVHGTDRTAGAPRRGFANYHALRRWISDVLIKELDAVR